MSDSHTGGVVVGVLFVLFLFPFALVYGSLSVAFHRGKPADTFARGVGLPCRVVLYVVVAGIIGWLFVFAMLIDGQMTMFVLWTVIAAALAYRYVYRAEQSRGGGAL